MSLLAAETDFGLSLLNQTPLTESAVLSPLSVFLALSLVHAGAKGNTRDEISNSLAKNINDQQFSSHFSEFMTTIKASNNNKTDVRIANRLFARQGFEFKPQYLTDIKKYYGSEAKSINVKKPAEAAKTMNDFVEDTTNGKIKNLIQADSITPETAGFLINAVYFKAEWEYKFSNHSTTNFDFHSNANKKRNIPFLVEHQEHRLLAEDADFQLLKLNYVGGDYAFSIILPKKRFGLSELWPKLTGAKIQNLLENVKSTYMNVKIPKMKIESDLDLKKALPKLGIKQMFGDDADLSGIAKTPLKISEGKTRAIIEVDEDGTTAAAATFFKVVPMSLNLETAKDFLADQPFIFALTYENHPLFVGRFQ